MSTKHVGYEGAEEITGIKKSTLYALVNQKRIPHLRFGRRHVMFVVPDLLKWIEQHKVAVEVVPFAEKCPTTIRKIKRKNYQNR